MTPPSRGPASICRVAGAAGAIDCLIDFPAAARQTPQVLPPGASAGLVIIGHPHPLYGGTRDNKVAATLARAFTSMGWISVRPDFRGVGASEGEHDHGQGETEDFLLLAEALRDVEPLKPHLSDRYALAMAGFSFGSFVAASAAQRLAGAGRPLDALVLVGTAAGKWPVPPVPPGTLVIHGERDETIPITEVFRWALTSDVPVVTLPGADHFFHRRLTQLKAIIQGHLAGRAALGWSDAASAGASDD